MNKEIETLNYNIQTLEQNQHGGGGHKGSKKGGHKSHGSKHHPRPKDGKGPRPQKKFKK